LETSNDQRRPDGHRSLPWRWTPHPRKPILRACLIFFALISLLHDPLFHPESSMAVVLALGAAAGSPGSNRGPPLLRLRSP